MSESMREGRYAAFRWVPYLGIPILLTFMFWVSFWPVKVCTTCINELGFNSPPPPKHGVTRIDWIDQEIDRLVGGGTYVHKGNYAGNADKHCRDCHGRGKVALIKRIDPSRLMPLDSTRTYPWLKP